MKKEFKIKNNIIKKYLLNEKEVIIPKDIIRIDDNAFINSSELESIHILGNNTTLGNYVFNYCPKLKYVYVDDTYENFANRLSEFTFETLSISDSQRIIKIICKDKTIIYYDTYCIARLSKKESNLPYDICFDSIGYIEKSNLSPRLFIDIKGNLVPILINKNSPYLAEGFESFLNKETKTLNPIYKFIKNNFVIINKHWYHQIDDINILKANFCY